MLPSGDLTKSQLLSTFLLLDKLKNDGSASSEIDFLPTTHFLKRLVS